MRVRRDLNIDLFIDGDPVVKEWHKLSMAIQEGFLDWKELQEWFQTNKSLVIPAAIYSGQMIEWARWRP
jgi:hypothetical protein